MALQLLLRRRPEWRRHAVAVVDEDRPQGRILWVNERARRARIWPGRRYAEGLSLLADLRAGVVPAAEIEAAAAELLRALRAFSPEIEPGADPGVHWLNASGVERLYGSRSDSGENAFARWGQKLLSRLADLQLRAAAVVGFDRFATYALARASAPGRVTVCGSAADEREASDRVPLHRTAIEPSLRDALLQLGVEDVGGLRRLPAGSLRTRFGAEADRVHRAACGGGAPLSPAPVRDPLREQMECEPGASGFDVQGLLFLCKQRLARLAAGLSGRGEAVAALHLTLRLERAAPHRETVRPAEPTLDEVQLIDLLRLRLESVQLEAEVEGFELTAETAPAGVVQRQLFAAARRRDLAAANRALARLRAELGDAAVVCAVVRDGHLPEAKFAWQPLQRMRAPQPEEVISPRLVRRVLDRPRLLAPASADDHGRGEPVPDVQGLSGPFVVSGGWWRREQHREYYFAETRGGDVLWVYYDRRRRRWFLQGVVD